MSEQMQAEDTDRRSPLWVQWVTSEGSWRRRELPDGAVLAGLRRGAGRSPGTVPSMWEHHTEDPEKGWPRVGDVSARFAAEHCALVLYGFHQQGQREPVHQEGARLGKALKSLHAGGRFSEEAIDRRFHGAIASDELNDVAYHLRSLVAQFRSLKRVVPLDYSRLVDDLAMWADVQGRDRVRRRWGLDYHAFGQGPSKVEESNDQAARATVGHQPFE